MRRLGFLVFTLVAGPTIALIWTQIVPLYGATAEIQVSPVIPGLVDQDRTIPFYDSFVNTQVSIVRNSTVLQRVLERADVRATSWWNDPPVSLLQRLLKTQVPHMERLRENLDVRPRTRTEIIDIFFTARSNQDAETIVNAVLDEYIKFSEQRRDETREDLDQKLATEYDLLERQIETQERVCANLRKELRTGNPEEIIGAQRVRLEQMEDRLSELDITISLLEFQIKTRQSRDSNDVRSNPSGQTEQKPAYDDDADGRSHAKQGTVMVSSREGGTDSPYASDLVALESQLGQAKYEKMLRESMWQDQKRAFDALIDRAQRLAEQEDELRHLYETSEKLREAITRRNMERKIPKPIAILTRAATSSKPYRDRRLPYTAIALAVALALGCGTGLLARKSKAAPRNDAG